MDGLVNIGNILMGNISPQLIHSSAQLAVRAGDRIIMVTLEQGPTYIFPCDCEWMSAREGVLLTLF